MCHNSGVLVFQRIIVTLLSHIGRPKSDLLIGSKKHYYEIKTIRNMVTSRKDSIYIHNFNHYLYDYFMPLDCTPQLLSAMFATGYSTHTSISTSGFIAYFPTLPHRLIFPSTGNRYYHPPCYLSQSFRSYPQFPLSRTLSFL